MAKVKTLTSMNRDGLAIPGGQTTDSFTDDEAVALVTNGLAEPVGWTLVEGKVVPDDAKDDKSKKKPAA